MRNVEKDMRALLEDAEKESVVGSCVSVVENDD
jgi:hypothetical protein